MFHKKILHKTLLPGYLLMIGALMSACGGAKKQSRPPARPVAKAAVKNKKVSPPRAAAAVAPSPPPIMPKTQIELQVENQKAQYDACTARDAQKFAETFTEDGVLTMVGITKAEGRNAIAKTIQKMFDAFSDLRLIPSHMYQKENPEMNGTERHIYVTEWVFTGKHTGVFMGQKPTDKQVGFNGVTVFVYTPEGLVKEARFYYDPYTVLAQLGVAKRKARAIPENPGAPELKLRAKVEEEDQNINTVQAMYDAMTTKGKKDENEKKFLELLSDNVELINYSRPETFKGKEDLKKYFRLFTRAFPEGVLKVNEVTKFGAIDDVVFEYEVEGKGVKARYFEATPNNKKFVEPGVAVFHIEDGKIVEIRNYLNSWDTAIQLGLTKRIPFDGDASKEAKTADKQKS